MPFHPIPPDAFLETPWRNGGGVTRQIAIAPEDTTVSGPFDWRVSTATVGSSGPFSPFPGFDRTLLLLDGEGMVLDFGPQGGCVLNGPFLPVAFSGDWTTTGTLRGSACTDFNVFTRREVFRHEVLVLRGTTTLQAAHPTLLHGALGDTEVDGWGSLPQGHALLVTGSDPITVRPQGVLLAVQILPA